MTALMTPSLAQYIAISLFMLGGCMSSPTPSEVPQTGVAAYKKDIRLGEKVGNVCFAGQIGEYRLFGRDTLIVTSGFGDEFILDIAPGCTPLEVASSVKMEPGNSCLAVQNEIVIAESSGVSANCRVQSINRWHEDVDPVDLQGIRPEDVEPVMDPLK